MNSLGIGSIRCLGECRTMYKFTYINVRIVFACRVHVRTLFAFRCKPGFRCRDSTQEILQAYNASVLCKNFRKLIFFLFLFVLKLDRGSCNNLCATGTYGSAVWAIGLKFSAFVKNRLGYKMTLTALFLQFFFAYTVTITDDFGPNYVT